MARLHEYQGKQILEKAGIAVPRGGVARTGAEAQSIAANLGGSVVVKVQAWTTGRAAAGGVAFAESPLEAGCHAERMLAMRFGRFPVNEVIVEEKIPIARELFVSFAIDERERAPVLLLAATGGSGIEERAGATHKILCHVSRGPDAAALRDAIAALDLTPEIAAKVERNVRVLFTVAQAIEARSLEINPLVITSKGTIVAADCRVTVDDYAVMRHPELGIEIARELDHPPTELERIAYRVEQDDHRGTFFFAQMNSVEDAAQSRKPLIGFHGAGGGGSMMSMDAITNAGFTVANFCDTSGNPSPAKVYRATRIILSQPGLVGYFGSGSGVANQEQYWSGYGLAKAFWEMNIDIPVVIRLGGNTEDRAVEILQSVGADVPAKIQGYKKTDSPAAIASKMAAMVAEQQLAGKGDGWSPRMPRCPEFVGRKESAKFDVKGGRVWIDIAIWKTRSAAIIARSNGLLRDNQGSPALTVTPEEFQGKDGDMIACEVECRRDRVGGVFVELDIPGLDELIARKAGA